MTFFCHCFCAGYPAVTPRRSTLFVANDNDFVANVAGPSQFFVFAFTDRDLHGFVQRQFVPEPASIAVLAAGLLGFGLLGRRSKHQATALPRR